MTDLPTVHMIIKNEDRFIWYSVQSVLPYAGKIIIFDTGSSDNTIPILEQLQKNSDKIIFEKKKIEYTEDIAQLRTEQIDRTDTDWFWVVDGDEIYTRILGEEILDILNSKSNGLEGIVVRRYDLIGDIYHYQDERVGTYHLFGKAGHMVIRLLNKSNLPQLNVRGLYPYEGYYDELGTEIIHHSPVRYTFTNGRMFHAMYLQRSSRGQNLADTFHRSKWKIETGISFPRNMQYPEVFSMEHPDIVPNVRNTRGKSYEAAALILTPVKQLKRNVWRKVKPNNDQSK